MTTAKNIIEELERMFPYKFKMAWDTTEGLVVGNVSKPVKKVIVSLEFRDNIITKGVDMFVLHHPPIFGPENKITNPSYKKMDLGGKIVYALHSRIDRTGFMSQAIAEKLFMKDEYKISKILADGTAILELKKQTSTNEIIERIKRKLKLKSINTIIKSKSVKRIGVHGGEAFQNHHISDAVKENIDLYLGGDMTHHLAEGALFFNANFIDIGHFSEQEGMRKLALVLKNKFPNVKFEYVEQTPLWSIK